MRILVIDDEELIGRVIQRGLPGHEVDAASRPSEGLAMHVAGPYELAFIDINLPEMSGPTVAVALKRQSPLRVVLMSGDVEAGDYSLAGCEVLDKPFTMPELQACVARAQLLHGGARP